MDEERKQRLMQDWWGNSQLGSVNAAYLEQLYDDFLQDPKAVDSPWREFFAELPPVNGARKDASHRAIIEFFRGYTPKPFAAESEGAISLAQLKQVRVLQLINAYRFRGHMRANINPLQPILTRQFPLPRLELTENDLDTVFSTGSLAGPAAATLRQIIEVLETTYCDTIGWEYMHITDPEEKVWIQNRVEMPRSHPNFSPEVKRRILQRLTAAEGLERYLHTKYLGQKRFSLEGAESLIPMLDALIAHSGEAGVEEVVIGMAHRGRLNVLINIMGKAPKELFSEFEGTANGKRNTSGDVKYHQGYSTDVATKGRDVHVALAFNPSHLEIVGPVVEGSVRARQDRRNDKDGGLVLPVILHGDAAFAGQGVVMETLNMSQSRGFSTKGTVHIVINNQVGFTTSHQRDARSTMYCTDVAKMVNAPILHVNGDDPEAVVFAVQTALDYRMKFRKDVVIDLVCYRRHGHNEADEPWITQPVMYKTIRELPTTRTLYAKKLVAQNIVTEEQEKKLIESYKQALEKGDPVTDQRPKSGSHAYINDWHVYTDKPLVQTVDTRVSPQLISDLGNKLVELPPNFTVHFAVAKLLDSRKKMALGEVPIDWGFAETMAYATLLHQGYRVRLSGQDCGRGTFAHRHAVLHDQNSGKVTVPLRNLGDNFGNFLVIDSLLSEEAVLAFEYGYASTDPKTLTIWEAQFGDFANGAQVVIDQFISAGEQKWNRLNGLVMLLPHGYEGQGPEHSSARLERYLQLCAEHNMQVCMPTTAAQIYHLLRRQMMMPCRKPLIVMTPKSLLRHKLASSSLKDLTDGKFYNILPEGDAINDDAVKRIIVCSGKVYYDLLEKRRGDSREDVAIIRMEQLYPFPTDELSKEFQRYKNATEFVWCQEEPINQGAWFTSQHHVRAIIGRKSYLVYAGRQFSAAPACGYMNLHKKQLEQLLADAFAPIAKD